jgi:hypothetical protein
MHIIAGLVDSPENRNSCHCSRVGEEEGPSFCGRPSHIQPGIKEVRLEDDRHPVVNRPEEVVGGSYDDRTAVDPFTRGATPDLPQTVECERSFVRKRQIDSRAAYRHREALAIRRIRRRRRDSGA